MSQIITPDPSFAMGAPEIGVEIYPHEGGQFTFDGSKNGIISAEITKNIRQTNGGSFSIDIAPGGPNGVEDKLTWTSIITPNSLVVIYLSRSNSKRIVMIGIVTKIEEAQIWNNRSVIRTIKITGLDFNYYFS